MTVPVEALQQRNGLVNVLQRLFILLRPERYARHFVVFRRHLQRVGAVNCGELCHPLLTPEGCIFEVLLHSVDLCNAVVRLRDDMRWLRAVGQMPRQQIQTA
eukprot:CAMPEP_0174372866 /NCGR_PEP_ID=MMETSP0811_2-20130205/104970_1 /TAXON_ID=73025 ORGANISM="Eutreptiella gymnastica-like, Strain CCMP1594" /NCGR_SAMPLE_ID=MMETSP0811_2 /ASSEMBLY_ACC=CAM_ASM_000667 /LENGTH=101 /DNA_ID=CAMNT_0015520629 /DNA_START=66 /DNA_END=371 /DNA_ORIENTATION=+